MTVSSVFNNHQARVFAHFFPEETRENATTKLFIQTVLPFLNQQWHLNTDRILHKIRSFKDQMKVETYEKCLNATQKYLNSRDFSVAGRYEVKKSWFFSGIQSYGETPRFQQLNSGLKALLKEVQPRKASWSESFRACWNGFIDCCASAVSYTYNNPGKTACTMLVFEAAALTLRSQHDGSLIDEMASFGNSPFGCGSNLALGLSGTLLTQNPLYITTAGLSCLPVVRSQIVNGQIPDQLLNVGDPFSLDINMTELFGEPVTGVGVTLEDGTALPNWLMAGPKVVGSIATFDATDVKIKGNIAYVADDWEGIKIIDVSNSTSPILKGSLATYDALGVAVRGNFAYVADSTEGLKIIDVSNSSQPILKSSLLTTNAYGVIVQGDYVYVADCSGGLRIVDVNNSAQPILKSSFTTTSAREIVIQKDYAYVADYTSGLKIIDVSNSSYPILKGSLKTSCAYGVGVSENFAYVTDDASGLRIIDVSDSTHPKLISNIATTRAKSVAIVGNFTYVADYTGGVQIIDVSNKASPILKGTITTTIAHRVVIDGNYAYIANGRGGLKIADLTFWHIDGTPVMSGQKFDLSISGTNSLLKMVNKTFSISTDYFPKAINPFTSQSLSMTSEKPLTVRLNIDNLFQDMDVKDTLNLRMLLNETQLLPGFLECKIKPILRGNLATTYALGIAVSGNYAYIADYSGGLKIIDISDSASPVLKGSLAISNAWRVAVSGNHAYVASSSSGLKIIDVSDSSHPILKSSLVTTGALGVAVDGNFAYVADGPGGLKIVDVSNSTHPILKSSLATTSARGVIVDGHYAYVADYTDGLKIIEVSNNTNPILTGSIVTTQACAVAISGNYAYVADYGSGLRIIDVSDPSHPLLKGTITTTDTDGLANAVTISGKYAYVADGPGGLLIIDVSNSTLPSLVGRFAIPNAGGITVSNNLAFLAVFTSGLEIVDLTNYQFTATPVTRNDEGNYALTVVATDPLLASGNTTFLLRVEGAPRRMQPLPRQMAIIDQPFSSFIPEGTFWDPNNDVITYSSKSMPPFLTFNPASATLWGIPGDSDKGEYNITILATDRITPPTVALWSVLVHYPPVLNKQIPDQAANINHLFQFTLDPHTFIHKDGYPLTYSSRQDNQDLLPQWLHFDNKTQTFNGLPLEGDGGTLTLAVDVDDGLQGQATGTFDLVVEHFPQLVKNIRDVYAAAGHSFAFDASSCFVDEDSESLQFSANSEGEALPKSLTFDKAGKFSGIPQPSDKGVIPITLSAMDPNGGIVTVQFNITIDDYAKVLQSANPPEVVIDNRSPQLVEPLLEQTFSADVRGDFSIRSSFEDPDGDSLTFNADLGDAYNWLTLDPTSGQFSGTPSSRDAATYATRRYTIGVTATDPANKTTAGSFEILLQGPSFTEKILTALMWISGFAVATWGYYQKKYLLWNWCRKKKYQQPDWNISVGQTGITRKVNYPANRIKQINVIRIKDRCCLSKDSCCFDICKNTEERTSQGSAKAYLFDWLYYEPKSNQFRIVENGPDAEYLSENIQIQIRGTDNRIMEQFTIKVRDTAAISDVTIASEDPSAIALQEVTASAASTPSSSNVASVSMSALSCSSSSAQSSASKQALLKTPLLDSTS